MVRMAISVNRQMANAHVNWILLATIVNAVLKDSTVLNVCHAIVIQMDLMIKYTAMWIQDNVNVTDNSMANIVIDVKMAIMVIQTVIVRIKDFNISIFLLIVNAYFLTHL